MDGCFRRFSEDAAEDSHQLLELRAKVVLHRVKIRPQLNDHEPVRSLEILGHLLGEPLGIREVAALTEAATGAQCDERNPGNLLPLAFESRRQ